MRHHLRGRGAGGLANLRGALLVTGTASDAGKSTLVAGLCRWLSREGVRVAPFKAQNMSNNSVVTPEGGEIGRAQALQAQACGLAPSVRFNPVLLKPGADGTSQVVVSGRAVGAVAAHDYHQVRADIADTVFRSLRQLRADYDVVVCEGAGSPAEINLRASDLANMGLATTAELPTLLVGDIDRGGALAAMFGTVAVMPPRDQRMLAGFVVNKFRGDAGLLRPGLDMLTHMTGRQVYGVLPYQPDLRLDTEDSLGYTDGRLIGHPRPGYGQAPLRVAVVRLPCISNATDVEALAAEPGVRVRLVSTPADVDDADLLVLPGTRATVADLDWLRRRGLADALIRHLAAGRPLLGICGGYQMLADNIDDPVESGRGTVPGLGVIPGDVVFRERKTLRNGTGTALGAAVGGYEIHHGTVVAHYGQSRAPGSDDVPAECVPLVSLPDGGHEGCRLGQVFGTHWHGAFEHDRFRRQFLTEVAALAGRDGFRVAPDTDVAAQRGEALDQMADLVQRHLDTDALLQLMAEGAPPGLPTIAPAGPHGPPDPSGRPSEGMAGSAPGPPIPTGTPADLVRPVVEGHEAAGRPAELRPPAARPPEPAVHGRRQVVGFAELADTVLAAPARLGGTRLVAVDGRAGSGKTTFAGRLAAELRRRQVELAVLHTDDLLQGWLDIVTFWHRLREWVLEPLSAAKPAAYRRFDWSAGRFRDEWEPLGQPGVLLVEGVTAARSAGRHLLSASMYVHAQRMSRFERALRRDGAGVLSDWSRWMLDEDEHFATDPTVASVDVVVDGEPSIAHQPEIQYVRITPEDPGSRGFP